MIDNSAEDTAKIVVKTKQMLDVCQKSLKENNSMVEGTRSIIADSMALLRSDKHSLQLHHPTVAAWDAKGIRENNNE